MGKSDDIDVRDATATDGLRKQVLKVKKCS
jgi:hypothetical protein